MAAIEPFPIEPPGAPDEGGWEGSITQIKTNLTNNLETIVQTPANVVHGVQGLLHTVGGWFADPGPPATDLPPILGPSEQATLPTPDPPVVFTGPSVSPTWGEVWEWQDSTAKAQTPELTIPTPVVGPQVQHAIQVSAGQTIKALSGYINQTLNLATLASDVLAQHITDTQTVIGALNNNQALTNQQMHSVLDLVVNEALPKLWAEANALHAQIQGTATALRTDLQQWVNANVRNPLTENLGQEKAARIAQVDTLELGLPGIIAERVAGMGLAAASDVASLAQRVTALETENTECTEPMCDAMGPNTNLGKLLKALSLAADAAFIAELLAMKESDVVAFIQTAAGKLAGVIEAVETGFLSGGETIGDFVKNTITSAA